MIRKAFALSLLAIMICISLCPEMEARTKIKSKDLLEEGVYKTFFTISQLGQVVVYLPGKLKPGDKFSGSVKYRAFGKNKEAKLQNLKSLKSYSVQVRRAEVLEKPANSDDKIPPPQANQDKSQFSGVIPEKNRTLEIVLMSGEKKAKYSRLKLEKELIEDSSLQKSSYVPNVSQCGHPVVISGRFDGNFKNTKVKVGGENCLILAESPRDAVFQSPYEVVGKTELKFSDATFSGKSEIVNLKLRLRAHKAKLKMGEKTTIRANVEGIGDSSNAVELVLVNMTPDVVSVKGGDQQVVRIPPGGRN